MKKRMGLGPFMALAAGLLVGAATAEAQTVGSTVSDVVTVSGKQVPIPPGEFTVVAVGLANAQMKKAGFESDRLDLGPIRTVTLAQVDNGRVPVVIEVAVNLLPHHDGWGTTADCTRKDLYAALSNYKSGWDVSCLYLKPLPVTGDVPAPGGAALKRFAGERKAAVSSFWIVAGLRVADRQDVVDVRYHVDPASLGLPASAQSAAEWEPKVIEQQPARLGVVKDLAAWAGRIAAPLSDGLRGRLPATTGSFPKIAGAASMPPDAEVRAARAAALQRLLDASEISQAEYEQQMAAIAGPAAEAAGSWTYAQVAGWKAFTYRVVVTTINAGIDYVFIGQPFAAGVLVILQVVVNTTKFFFHEMMWQEVFGISPLQRDNPEVIEFNRIVTASNG